MKTMRKKEYVAPKMEILMVEMEEGIAGTSPGDVTTGASPQVNDRGTVADPTNGWSDDQF